jgi:hypothetical protein
MERDGYLHGPQIPAILLGKIVSRTSILRQILVGKVWKSLRVNFRGFPMPD